ncbi:hypothetical protein G9A89_003376 [Geosiphon pyriformis]|nr:hypothetical protein G9A89_003376 [Geosiphon pyriformis]
MNHYRELIWKPLGKSRVELEDRGLIRIVDSVVMESHSPYRFRHREDLDSCRVKFGQACFLGKEVITQVANHVYYRHVYGVFM